MQNKWEALRGSIGFYVTLAACLLVAGISGYFLLVDRDTPPAEPEVPVIDTTVSAPAPVTETTEEPDAIGVISPAPEVKTITSMPEVPVDNTPVTPEAPRIIVSPLKGQVLTAFSVDQLVYNPTLEDWRIHDGLDIAAEEGTSVLAASSGTVLSVKDDALMGTTVTLEHDGGYQTTYASLQAGPAVKAGDSVSAGQIIGAVGTAPVEAARGPHLHFSVEKDGDAVDPEEYLNQ